MDAQRRRLLWRMTSEKTYNNSTSCLVKNKAEAIAVANATVVPPRHSSTEGRFSILDAHAKSSDSESDFDTNQPPITFSRRVIPVSNFSKSVDFSAGTLPMSTSVSRFRIVPLESRYKRGRWTCYDYYEKNHVAKNAKLSLPATKNKSFDINNLSVRSLNEVMGPRTAPPLVGAPPQPLHVRFAFDLSSDDEGEIDAKRVPPARKEKPSPPAPNVAPPPAAASAPTSVQKIAPVTILTPPATLPALITTEIRADDTKILSAVKAADLGMTLSLNNGRLTPTEMQLQTGLESTLNTCSEAIIGALVQENKVVAKKKSPPSAPPPLIERKTDDTSTASAPIPAIVHIVPSALTATAPVAVVADAAAVCSSRPPSCTSLASIDFATPPNTPTTLSFTPIGLTIDDENTPTAPAAAVWKQPPLIVVCEWDDAKIVTANNTGKELRTIFGERKAQKSSSSASTTTNTGGNPSMVAIDSKIEQAMDLVKTHLMFAVREEVEVLRGRIVDLENTVCNLEAENAVLRQHVSEEILRNMNN